MKKVVIVQRRLTHYRVSLFYQLRKKLKQRGVELQLLHGEGTPEEEKKNDAGNILWATKIPTHYFINDRLCWQPIHRYLDETNLLVVTQENRLIANHLLMLFPRKVKLAFWGHGANLQSNRPNGVRERYKRWTTNQVDWWFAYTKLSASFVRAANFPDDRITVLNNAVDTREIQQQKESVTAKEISALRNSLGIGDDAPVGVFVGSLYSNKRLEFLFKAGETIRTEVPDFQLLVVGDGPERDKVRLWCDNCLWVHWAGTRFDREKVVYLSIAQVMLNPGLVGLGILDAFACGIPLVTTDCGIHSPEIAYLENGCNGIMTENGLKSYVDAIIHLIRNPSLLNTLQAGCKQSAKKYTLENMTLNFADGLERALKN